MKEFIALIVIFWIPPFISILKKAMWDLYFWQIKEFRWDRYWVHIRWDFEEINRDLYPTILKFILFSSMILIFEIPLLSFIAILIVYILWANESINFINDIISKRLKRPSLKNARNILILGIFSILIISTVAYISLPFLNLDRSDYVVYQDQIADISPRVLDNSTFIMPDVLILIAFLSMIGILFDLGSNIFITLLVALTHPIAMLKRSILIQRAKNKLKKLRKNLIVVGITGSIGKTTQKEVLKYLLKDKYVVASTPKNHNTDVGIAQTILNELSDQTQIFIVEAGAFKKGEIADIVNIIAPDIALVTEISNQHIGIFGSQQDLFEAKSELVKGLRSNGIAILNGDDKYSVRMSKLNHSTNFIFTQSKKIYNELLKEESLKSTPYLFSSKADKNKLNITLSNENDSDEYEILTDYEHLDYIFVQSIIAAKQLNISDSDIKSKLAKLDLTLPRLSIYKGDNDTIIIDDSYSSSLKGFIAATRVLKKQKGNNKFIVTKGIKELGKYKKEIYKNLVTEIHDNFDYLITTDHSLATIASEYEKDIVVVYASNDDEITYAIRKLVEPKDVILFEGRINPAIIEEISSDK